MQESASPEVSHTFVRKLEDCNGIEFGRVYSQPYKDLLDMFATALELVGETLLPPFLRVRIQRAFDMDDVIAANVNADHIQLPLMASVRPPSNEDGSPDEITVVLEPFRNQLL